MSPSGQPHLEQFGFFVAIAVAATIPAVFETRLMNSGAIEEAVMRVCFENLEELYRCLHGVSYFILDFKCVSRLEYLQYHFLLRLWPLRDNCILSLCRRAN